MRQKYEYEILITSESSRDLTLCNSSSFLRFSSSSICLCYRKNNSIYLSTYTNSEYQITVSHWPDKNLFGLIKIYITSDCNIYSTACIELGVHVQVLHLRCCTYTWCTTCIELEVYVAIEYWPTKLWVVQPKLYLTGHTVHSISNCYLKSWRLQIKFRLTSCSNLISISFCFFFLSSSASLYLLFTFYNKTINTDQM